MIIHVKDMSVKIPERSEAFLVTRGQCVRKTITLTEKSVEQLIELERQHNSSMSAVIRAGIELLTRASKGKKNGQV